jgi:hypothetical protein
MNDKEITPEGRLDILAMRLKNALVALAAGRCAS